MDVEVINMVVVLDGVNGNQYRRNRLQMLQLRLIPPFEACVSN